MKRQSPIGVWERMDVNRSKMPVENQGLAAELATAGAMLLGVLVIAAGLTVVSWQGSLGWLGLFLGVVSIALASLNRRWWAIALVAAGAAACLAGFAEAVSHWN